MFLSDNYETVSFVEVNPLAEGLNISELQHKY